MALLALPEPVPLAVHFQDVDVVGEAVQHGPGETLCVEDPGLFIPRGPERSVKTEILRGAAIEGKGIAKSDVLGPVVSHGRYRFVCHSKCWPVRDGSEPGMGPR